VFLLPGVAKPPWERVRLESLTYKKTAAATLTLERARFANGSPAGGT